MQHQTKRIKDLNIILNTWTTSTSSIYEPYISKAESDQMKFNLEYKMAMQIPDSKYNQMKNIDFRHLKEENFKPPERTKGSIGHSARANSALS